MKYLVLISSLVLSSLACAEQAFETGRISWILVHNGASQSSDMDKRVLIRLDGTMSGGFCTEKNWTILFNSKAAEAQYSMLLAAYIAGRSVRFSGHPSQVCGGNQEVVRNIEFT